MNSLRSSNATRVASLHNKPVIFVQQRCYVSDVAHLQSCSRCASDSDEKPAKTTLWIAPIRAHASIAIGSSHTCIVWGSTLIGPRRSLQIWRCASLARDSRAEAQRKLAGLQQCNVRH